MITLFTLLLLRHYGVAVSQSAIIWASVLLGVFVPLQIVTSGKVEVKPDAHGFWARLGEASWTCLTVMIFVSAGTVIVFPAWAWGTSAVAVVVSMSARLANKEKL